MSETAPVFSLAFTSVRSLQIPEVVNLWNQRSVLAAHEWVIAIDDGDLASMVAAGKAVDEAVQLKRCGSAKIVVNTGPKTCVAGWNAAAAATAGKVIIAVADDFMPPQNWDALLLSLEPKDWIDQERVIKTEDGYVHNIFVLSILTRKRYERFGYIFYPKYLSIFCDTEFGEVAMRDGVVIDANHLLFEHLHPDCHKRQRDGTDMVHGSRERWNAGEMLFKFRSTQGFPVDDGPLAAKYAAEAAKQKIEPSVKFNDRYVAYMQVIKDDLCLLDVCKRLIEEGIKDFCLCQPDRYWSDEIPDGAEVAELLRVVDKLREIEGITVQHKVFHVDDFRMPNDTRILVETRVRNESLSWIRSLGYRHILVVDSDELWMRGTLDIIKPYVEQGHRAISVHMVPVIGVPGYPVDGAMDVAVVYVGQNVNFKVCRSPYIPQAIVYRQLIYHFTGTRKGMDETVKKHRRGGHYDDPEYLFEEWIEKVLPNIAPDFTHKWPSGHEGLHMYAPRQIWPRVRPWRLDEIAAMPSSIQPYLGTGGRAAEKVCS